MRISDPRNDKRRRSEARERNGGASPFQKFEDFVKKIAAVPKEELDEQRVEHERERKESKRAG